MPLPPGYDPKLMDSTGSLSTLRTLGRTSFVSDLLRLICVAGVSGALFAFASAAVVEGFGFILEGSFLMQWVGWTLFSSGILLLKSFTTE